MDSEKKLWEKVNQQISLKLFEENLKHRINMHLYNIINNNLVIIAQKNKNTGGMEGGIWGEKCDINILLKRVSQILKSGKHYENTLQAH